MPPQLHPPSPPGNLRRLDSKIWRACAGTSVQIPIVYSRVYYFPQGHVEQSSPPPTFLSPNVLSKPLIHCRISAVDFLADPVTDEVFARLVLHPIHAQQNFVGCLSEPSRSQNDVAVADEDKILSFAKILTPSDANNGGGFSVPRFCADSIFPPLNYHAEPPVQTLSVTDVHGVVWEFRHIYRGTPRRHLLTTGWSKFVNHKKLVAGDSVVFMRNRRGQMFVGVRRAVRFNNDCAAAASARWSSQIGGGTTRLKPEDDNACARDGFSRSGMGKLSAEAMTEAAELAAQGLPFEVVYYPRAGWSDFVVKAEVVEEALNVFWTSGMKVRMAMETEDSSRMTWFQGTVSAAGVPDGGPWQGSPWRMLQVTWDEPEVLHNAKRVSPWQVEVLSPTAPVHTALPPTKKFRTPQSSVQLTDGEGDLFFPFSGYTNSTMGHVSQTLLNYNTFPASMQGARQNLFSKSSLSNFISENNMCIDNSFGNNTVPKLKTVSTELNIGSSQSENLSPDSQSSMHSSFGTEFVGTQYCSSPKVGTGSFQLFGKIIHTNQPVESGFDDIGCAEDDGSKGYNETDDANNPLDHSLSYTKLLDRLDVQCQRASAVGACNL